MIRLKKDHVVIFDELERCLVHISSASNRYELLEAIGAAYEALRFAKRLKVNFPQEHYTVYSSCFKNYIAEKWDELRQEEYCLDNLDVSEGLSQE